ncbi:hypothetical protein [Bradyrhizobium sp. AUGA SZCCT0431]|uniref:hypothetical protein n=1 Tax=Bradyrhizobium sp. AUGA SZCCT0431 TaxID=2807674 RepID=UPI001BA4D1C8|nr:hypothetical protein [Bradyrhizobium sp. AUGA SZCCT0431]MBR1145091.1 hypothetical protein [Bradyrhizobium sp. AUGA SZCCT0431]
MSEAAEITLCISFVRVSLDTMEAQASDPSRHAEILAVLKQMVSASMRQGIPERTSDKPPRGVGYGQKGKAEIGLDGKRVSYTTPDDAMIVASLPWFKGNWSAAIREHYSDKNLTKQDVDNHADRIKGHRREIEEFQGVRPWETSTNWLGDLPEE